MAKVNPEGYQKAIENELDIINKDREIVPFILNPPQKDFLYKITGKDIVLKARQMGFSSLILAILTIKFILGENERCVVVSHEASATQKLLDRVKFFINSFERKNDLKLPLKYNSRSEMVMEGKNNSFYIGTAGSRSFARGDTISAIHLSEYSFYPDPEGILAGAMQAVTPNGLVFIETTANGFNFFKTLWEESRRGERPFKTHFYGPEWAYSKEFLEEKKKELGRLYPQEYPENPEAAFISSGDTYFEKESMVALLERTKPKIDLEFTPLNQGWKQFRKIEKGEFFAVAVDTSSGGPDYTAAQFYSKTKMDVPIVFHSRVTTSALTNELANVLNFIFDKTGKKPVVAYERQNGGAFEMDRLMALNREGKFTIFTMPTYGRSDKDDHDQTRIGWDTTTATRPKMLEDLKVMVDKQLIGIYDRETINELFSFIVNQRSSGWKAEAAPGSHDDLVMALAIAIQVATMSKEEVTVEEMKAKVGQLPKENFFDNDGFY